jgi:NAD-dependent deacetylase
LPVPRQTAIADREPPCAVFLPAKLPYHRAMPLPISPRANIVILTGAGISRESGLDTFRDKDGIWSRVRIEDVATPEAFARDPNGVNEFYNTRRTRLAAGNVRPNAAHLALARLEAGWPGEFLLVTQNIDDLHERAGSNRLTHMHGELLKVRCTDCGSIRHWPEPVEPGCICPECSATDCLRPHVVWFGEIPFGMESIYQQLARCDLFIAIGTSASVYPAAGFVQEARRYGQARCVELNLEPSQASDLFHETRHGPASAVVPEFVAELLAGADAREQNP